MLGNVFAPKLAAKAGFVALWLLGWKFGFDFAFDFKIKWLIKGGLMPYLFVYFRDTARHQSKGKQRSDQLRIRPVYDIMAHWCGTMPLRIPAYFSTKEPRPVQPSTWISCWHSAFAWRFISPIVFWPHCLAFHAPSSINYCVINFFHLPAIFQNSLAKLDHNKALQYTHCCIWNRFGIFLPSTFEPPRQFQLHMQRPKACFEIRRWCQFSKNNKPMTVKFTSIQTCNKRFDWMGDITRTWSYWRVARLSYVTETWCDLLVQPEQGVNFSAFNGRGKFFGWM